MRVQKKPMEKSRAQYTVGLSFIIIYLLARRVWDVENIKMVWLQSFDVFSCQTEISFKIVFDKGPMAFTSKNEWCIYGKWLFRMLSSIFGLMQFYQMHLLYTNLNVSTVFRFAYCEHQTILQQKRWNIENQLSKESTTKKRYCLPNVFTQYTRL